MSYLLIFHRLILRALRAEPLRTALTVLAVALGVAVVLAIEMSGEAAAGSFRASIETLAGKADFEVTSSGGVPPETLTTLARLPYPLKLRPRIEDYATLVASGRTVPLIGVDFLTDASADEIAGRREVTENTTDFGRDESIWAGSKLGLAPGGRVRLLINDQPGEFTIRGLLPASAGDVIVADISSATRLLRRSGVLDRILIEAPSDGRDWQSLLNRELGPGVTVAPFGSRTGENRRMLAALRWNLRVLSYIALVVGAFLIYNTISVSVVRRRPETGILRALGATRTGVLVAFVSEAFCFGLAGGAIGVLLGRILASSAVRLVSMTVESLYVSSQPGDISLTPMIAVVGLLTGVGVAVVSALAPAWEASRVPPAEAMSRGRREHEVRLRFRRNLVLAAALAGLAWFLSRQPAIGGRPVAGYLSALCLIGALAAAIAPMVASFCLAVAGLMKRVFGVPGLLATRSLQGSLRRTSVLAGALATAVAMTAAVGIMVGSFRQTVVLWMEDRLKADLYVRPAGRASADRHPVMAADSADRLRAIPEVEAVDAFRAYEISYEGMPATLGASDAHVAGRYGRRGFVSGRNGQQVFEQLASGQNVAIVSEPFANKHHVGAGNLIHLRLQNQAVSFRVLDVYYDYSSERGFVFTDRKTLLRYLPDPAPSNLAVYLRSGVSVEDGRRAVERALAGRRLLVFTNRTLREEAIRTFDRTFTITYALEAIAVFVAIMGVAGALLALVIDRRRQFGLLRFLGGATAQIRSLILFEAGLLGFAGNLTGLAVGYLLSLLLIFVINKQSFGWTLQFHWPVAMLLGTLSLVFAATVAAALYPATIAARLNPIEVVHEE